MIIVVILLIAFFVSIQYRKYEKRINNLVSNANKLSSIFDTECNSLKTCVEKYQQMLAYGFSPFFQGDTYETLTPDLVMFSKMTLQEWAKEFDRFEEIGENGYGVDPHYPVHNVIIDHLEYEMNHRIESEYDRVNNELEELCTTKGLLKNLLKW